MSIACIFVKSLNRATYEIVVERICGVEPNLQTIHWCFYDMEKNTELVEGITRGIGNEFHVIKEPGDILNLLEKSPIFDVSGLPKEHYTEVLSVFLGLSDVKLLTLTQDKKSPYQNLMEGKAFKELSRKHSNNEFKIKIASDFIIFGLIALGIVKLTEFIPYSNEVVTWLGITVGFIGAALSIRSKISD